MNVTGQAPTEQRFFRISLHAIPPYVPLPCDTYIIVANKLTLLRRTGDTFTAERLRKLNRHEVQEFYVPVQQRPVFKEFLWRLLLDPTVPVERRTESAIETAYLQAEDIDQQAPEFGPGISELVEMLQKFGPTFVSATSLGQLVARIAQNGPSRCHGVQTALYAMLLSAKAFPEQRELVWQAGVAGMLHDIGEQRLDSRLVDDHQSMNGEDWQLYKSHPNHSVEGLAGIESVPVDVKKAILEHHEHFDGTGFPRRLQGEEIGPIARVLALCDTLDRLMTGKGGGAPLPPDEALLMMQTIRPERFDPRLLSLLAAELRSAGRSVRGGSDAVQPELT